MNVSIVDVGRAKLDVWTAAESRKWFKKMLGPPFPLRILSLVFFFSPGIGIPFSLIRINIIYLIQAQQLSHRKNWGKQLSRIGTGLSHPENSEHGIDFAKLDRHAHI